MKAGGSGSGGGRPIIGAYSGGVGMDGLVSSIVSFV